MIKERVDEFFWLARERHSIYLKRRAGEPYPWTEDYYLSRWRFCCVFRELDKTTAWFRDHVREPLRARPEVLLATVVFRLLNRIESGEAVFTQPSLMDTKRSAFEIFLETKDTDHLRWSIKNYVGARGPYVTGSYIIKTPDGLTKLDGVLQIIEWFLSGHWLGQAKIARQRSETHTPMSLEEMANWLESYHRFIGHFTAYEIVSDLRHTDLLCRAPDIMTWANPGPGATRGLNYFHGRELSSHPPRQQMLEEMRELLALSQRDEYWPQYEYYPAWEMREVEHWLCEYFKIMRAKDGGQVPRQRFRPC